VEIGELPITPRRLFAAIARAGSKISVMSSSDRG